MISQRFHIYRAERGDFFISIPPATEQPGTEHNDFTSISQWFHIYRAERGILFFHFCTTSHRAAGHRAAGHRTAGHRAAGHRAAGHPGTGRAPAEQRRRHATTRHESQLFLPAASTLRGIIAALTLPRSFASPRPPARTARTARTTRTETEIDFPVVLTPQPPIHILLISMICHIFLWFPVARRNNQREVAMTIEFCFVSVVIYVPQLFDSRVCLPQPF